MAVISGGGTVPETGIDHLAYNLNWVNVPVGEVKTIPAESALILRYDSDTGQPEVKATNGKVNIYSSNNVIQVTSDASNPIKEIMVYNMQGSLLYHVSSINAISYTINHKHPAGLYIVKVISGMDSPDVKIIKQ
jgi:hypothetical protein